VADKVQFDLVSPERLVFSEAVDMVVVPGTEGDFGVLAGHAPVMSSLRPGVVEVHDEGGELHRIFVARGFAEVTSDHCTVLAEDSVPVDELDRAGLEQRLSDAREDIEDATTDEERHHAEAAVALFEEMLRAVG
jgi:F-type H+-transporting ATPase subunit epsilon